MKKFIFLMLLSLFVYGCCSEPAPVREKPDSLQVWYNSPDTMRQRLERLEQIIDVMCDDLIDQDYRLNLIEEMLDNPPN